MQNRPLSSLLGALNLTPPPVSPLIRHCQIDSRLVRPGDLFFALPGEKADGHSFLQQVKDLGGVGAVVKQGYKGYAFGLQLCFVEDVLKALQTLARIDLEESGATVIGITGSVGKTTTKDFIATLLQAKYRVGKTPGNYNTRCTLPLSILNREGGEEVLVLEMGMEEPEDIGKLLMIADPEIAVVTKIALAHAAFFPGGLAQIAQNKAEIFSGKKLHSAIFPAELTCFSNTVEQIPMHKRIEFSLESSSSGYRHHSQGDLEWIYEKGIASYSFAWQMPRYLLHNFLASVAVARKLGLTWEEIEEKRPFLTMPKMRFERIEKEGAVYINDAYNANPTSMKAAFESLPAPRKGGRKIGVLGVMSPLGSFSKSAHSEVGQAAKGVFDLLFVLGSEAKPLFDAFCESQKPAEFFLALPELAKRLEDEVREGDVVLVKGSRIMQMETLFGTKS